VKRRHAVTRARRAVTWRWVSSTSIDLSVNVRQVAVIVIDLSVDVTQVAVIVTSLSVNVRQVAAGVIDLSVNVRQVAADVTDLSVNVTQVSADVTDLSVNMTQVSADVTDLSVNVTQVSADVTDLSVNVTRLSVVAIDLSTGEALLPADETVCMPIEIHRFRWDPTDIGGSNPPFSVDCRASEWFVSSKISHLACLARSRAALATPPLKRLRHSAGSETKGETVMKTIALNETVLLSDVELKRLKRKLGTLSGLARTIRGMPVRMKRTELSLLAELDALQELGRNVAWRLMPTEAGLACFEFRFEAVVRGVFVYLDRIDPDHCI
jgi:hypothetical protein